MKRPLVISIIMVIVIAIVGSIAIFLAKGYRLSPKTGTIAGTGIMSVTSVPDQASVYLDGHLTTATNANINSLSPKTYDVKIVKEGFITWEKQVEVKEGLVSEIKATLFRAIPSVYPLTYTGAQNLTLSPDEQKIVYVVPGTEKKSGVWVWQMSDKPITFGRASGPQQLVLGTSGIDYSQAVFKWSPDSRQIMVTFPDRTLLLESDRLNDPPRDITATLTSVVDSWDVDTKSRNLTRLNLIKDIKLKQEASNAAVLKWSPDESKYLYSKDGKEDFKLVNLETKKTYTMSKANSYSWLPDSDHLVLVEGEEKSQPVKNNQAAKDVNTPESALTDGKISIIDFDGSNKAEIYAGRFDLKSVVAWPDSSRLIIISSVPTATGNMPNLFGINLK